MVEAVKIVIKRLWRISRMQSIFWLGVIVISPLILIQKKTSITSWLKVFISSDFCCDIIYHFSWIITELLLLCLLLWIYNVHIRIGKWSRGENKIRQSIKNITCHLLDNSTACNLYGNILISKLVGAHQPRERNEMGDSFWLIRHKKDFEYHPDYNLPSNTHLQLIDSQIEDFKTIQHCIAKYWDTVVYGDTTVLLEKPEYIAHNVRMIYGKFLTRTEFFLSIAKILRPILKKKAVRRLFIYPYYTGNNIGEFINTLKRINLSKSILEQDLIQTNPSTNRLYTNVGIVQGQFPAILPDVAMAVRDAIYLVWLLRLHKYYGIDYRVIPRHQTFDSKNKDIVGDYFLNSWKDEGSALIDNEVIVRFDDQIKENGVIYYEFIKSPRSKLDNYKHAFDTIWSSASPRSYTIDNIKDFFSIFFNCTTTDALLQIQADNWIQFINKEL